MFHIPLRDIEETFTKSELVILGWRSQEQAYKMRLRMDRPVSSDTKFSEEESKVKDKGKRKEYMDAEVPEGLPDRFFDEEGEVNLSKATLKDAVQYMNAIGIKMPMPLPGKNMYSGRLVGKEGDKEALPTMDELFK